MKSANIFFTAALFETSATNAFAPLPPARSISVTTFCADSVRMSLIPTLAPSRAKVSPVSRPSPEPPPVISTTLSLSFTPASRFRFPFFQLALPVESTRLGACRLRFLYHALLLIEHAQVGEGENVLGLVLDVFVGDRDGGIQISLGLVTKGQALGGIGKLRVYFERLFVELDRIIEFVVGEKVYCLVAEIFFVGH